MAAQREIEERRLDRVIREQVVEEIYDRVQRVEMMSGTTMIGSGSTVITAAAIAGGLVARDSLLVDLTDETDDAQSIIEVCGLTEDLMFRDCLFFNSALLLGIVALTGGSGVTVANPGLAVAPQVVATLRFHRVAEADVVLYIRGGV